MKNDIVAALERADMLVVFQALAPSHQKEYLKWIDEAKKTETRQKRIAKTIEMLRKKYTKL